MVTVDDLVISLTIKETGKLGRLQKQLDALVGKTGKRGFVGTSGSLMYIKRDLNIIKANLKWLRPTRLPPKEDPRGMRRVAGSLLQDLSVFQKEVIEKLLRTPKIQTLHEEFGTKTTEELESKMASALDNIKETLGDIFDDVSVLSPAKKEEVTHTLDSIFRHALSRREVGLEFWRKISKFTPEAVWQSRIEKVFTAMGAKVTPQKPLYMVKPEAMMLEEIQKELGLGYSKEMLDVLKGIELRKSEVRHEVREVSPAELKKFQGIFGLQTFQPDLISKYIGDILASKDEEKINEMINKIKSGMFTKLTPTEIKNIGLKLISKESKEELTDIVKKAHNWTVEATMGAKRIDTEVDNFKVIRKEIGSIIFGRGEPVGIEIKKIITREDVEQLLMYMKYYGEQNVILLAEQKKSGVTEYAKALGVEKNISLIPNLRELEEKWTSAKALIDPESEKFLEDYQKITEDIFKDFAEKLVDPATTEKDREEILASLQKFKDSLNVNPNWVDLPGWTQDTGEQIRKIREQTDKIGTADSKRLFDMFLQLKDDLSLKDIAGKPENVESLISQLLIVYKGLEEAEEITGEEKDVLKYSMMKTVVDMRMREWKVLREEYAEHPTIIMEGLEEIKNITQELQEKEKTQWKTTLLGKMETLIKTVSDYRNELRTTIGRKYTEPPKQKGFNE